MLHKTTVTFDAIVSERTRFAVAATSAEDPDLNRFLDEAKARGIPLGRVRSEDYDAFKRAACGYTPRRAIIYGYGGTNALMHGDMKDLQTLGYTIVYPSCIVYPCHRTIDDIEGLESLI